MSRYRQPARHQGGFIQGAILVGLALLVMVVAAFSLASRDSGSNVSREQARMNASVILKQGVDVRDAIFRALSDNATIATLADLVTQGYLTELPKLPTDPSATPTWATYGTQVVASVGSTTADVFFTVSPLSDDLCKRINGSLALGPTIPAATDAVYNGTLPNLLGGGWPGRSEGCIPVTGSTANQNVYYKVAMVR